jgi:hypothetical protein
MDPDTPTATPEERAAAAEATAAAAVARYRELVASAPDVVPGMVQGATVEEIDASAEASRRAYAEISRSVAARYEADVPPGNPARSGSVPGAEALPPEAKIALGLQKAG